MTKLTTDRVHELKIYPEFFHPVCTGNKHAELRKNDRDYQVGDTLHLYEYSHTTGRTSEYVNVIVTHIADVSDWLPDYVLLSIKIPDNDAAPAQPVIPEQANILGYFSFDPEDGAEILKDRQTAIDNCNASIDLYRESMQEEYPDGWSDDVKRVCWGVILQEARGFDAQGIPEDDPNHTYQTLDYRLSSYSTNTVTAQPVSEPYKLEIDMDDADHFSITHLHEIIYGKKLIWPEAKLLARFMLDVKQRASAAPAQESE